MIGSTVFWGAWLKEPASFALTNAALLDKHPVWLLSSGPLDTAASEEEQRALPARAELKELPALRDAVWPRNHRVFSGALDAPSPGDRGQRLPKRTDPWVVLSATCCARRTPRQSGTPASRRPMGVLRPAA